MSSGTHGWDLRGIRKDIPALPFCHVQLRGIKPPNPACPKQLKTLGDHLRNRRLDRGMLQSEVAKLLAVTASSVWNWESNTSTPHWRYLKPIVEFLGYDPLPPAGTMAERLVRYRWLRGWTQKEMAKRLGVDPTTLARWERGEREPAENYHERVRRLLKSI